MYLRVNPYSISGQLRVDDGVRQERRIKMVRVVPPILQSSWLSAVALSVAGSLWSCPVTAQVLLNPSDLIKPADYPALSLQRGEEGFTSFQLTLDRSGLVKSCSIVESSGYVELDQKACELVSSRAKFDVSNVPAGSPVPTYRNRVRWTIPISGPRPAQVGVTVKETPSRVDTNKTRCEFSNGEVRFISSLMSCTAAQDRTDFPAPAMTSVNNSVSVDENQKSFFDNIKSARSGDVSSFVPVAIQYMNGIGVERDPEKALFWLRKAEIERVPDSYYYYAFWHFYGVGVDQNIQKSYDYLRLALSVGYTKPWVTSLEKSLQGYIGVNGYTCMGYGFSYRTPSYAMCNLELEQAQKQMGYADQQAEIERQKLNLELQRTQQAAAAAAAAQQQAQREVQARERRERTEALMRMSEDFLCPKVSPGMFAEPVAGCGRNKNQQPPPTVNVIIRKF